MLGWSWRRSSQADYVTVPVSQLVTKPAGLSWEVAGSLNVAGATAWAAVDAVKPQPGETVCVSAAAGGVGSIAVQLLRLRGASVIGIASAANHDWLLAHDVIPVEYGDGLEARDPRSRLPTGSTPSSTPSALSTSTWRSRSEWPPERIDTIIAFERAAEVGAQTEGSAPVPRPRSWQRSPSSPPPARLDVPIAATYPLERVQDAFAELEQRPHPRQDRPDSR